LGARCHGNSLRLPVDFRFFAFANGSGNVNGPLPLPLGFCQPGHFCNSGENLSRSHHNVSEK
jgi:hypothetical protein